MDQETDKIEKIVKDAAKEELLPRFNKIGYSRKSDGSIITEADHAVQDRIQLELKKLTPQIPFLGEEMTLAEQKKVLDSENGFWCLDPLDGTLNFSNGFPVFSVSLAFIKNKESRLGIVYDPIRDECFTALPDGSAALNGKPIIKNPPASPLKQGAGMIDMKRLPEELILRILREKPYSSQRSIGSVALEWCWIAAGRIHVYLHGKQNLWDYAAGYLVLKNTGGYFCSMDGEEFFKGDLSPRSAVAALDETHFREWTEFLKIHPRIFL